MSADKPTCGAKAKNSGEPCKLPAGFGTDHLGSGRCKYHGGCCKGPPKGSRNALKHGIYSAGIFDHELEIYEKIKVGTLDPEIKLARLQLRRAFIALRKHAESEGEHGLAELAQQGLAVAEGTFVRPAKKGKQAKGDRAGLSLQELKVKAPNFHRKIYELLGRIGDLEAKRALVLGGKPDHPDLDAYYAALGKVGLGVWKKHNADKPKAD